MSSSGEGEARRRVVIVRGREVIALARRMGFDVRELSQQDLQVLAQIVFLSRCTR